jgi:ATP-dependent Lon protease
MIDVHAPDEGDQEVEVGGHPQLPSVLPVLPLRDSVTYPDTLTPLAVGQERSIKLVNDVLGGNRMLAMIASRDPEVESPGPDDLYEVGVAGGSGSPAGRRASRTRSRAWRSCPTRSRRARS